MGITIFLRDIFQFDTLSISRKRIFYGSLLLLAFCIKLVFIPLADSIDADAFSRIASAERWLNNPTLITEGVWPPIHYYLIAFSIWIGGEHVISPVVLHIFFSIVTLIPLFLFTKREFNERGAFVVCLIYFLSPVVFRNSFHALSGIPHAFFIMSCMNFLSLGLKGEHIKYFILAGLSVTIAAGIRYEAWLLIAIFTFILLFKKKVKFMLLFWLAAMIFPIFWMLGNYSVHHDFLYGLSGAYHWNVVMEGVNDTISPADSFVRLVYFPLFFFLVSGPLLICFLLVRRFRGIRKRPSLDRFLWALPFLVLSVVFVIKALNGTLLLQHRFTILLTILFIPFLAIVFNDAKKRHFQRIITIATLILLPLTNYLFYIPFDHYFESQDYRRAIWKLRINAATGLAPLPQILDPEVKKQKSIISSKITKKEGLILDFDNWMNTSNIALNTRSESEMVFLLDGSKHGLLDTAKLKAFLLRYPSGLILVKCNSKLQQLHWLKDSRLNQNVAIIPEPIYKRDGISVHRYKTEAYHSMLNQPLTLCPDMESDDFKRMNLKLDPSSMADIYIKSRLNNRSIDEQIKLDLEWLENN